MSLSRAMKKRLKSGVAHVASVSSVDTAGIQQHGTPTKLKCFFETGFTLNGGGKEGRTKTDLDLFITEEPVVEGMLFWPPGVDETDQTKGKLVIKCNPINDPSKAGRIMHYEVYT